MLKKVSNYSIGQAINQEDIVFSIKQNDRLPTLISSVRSSGCQYRHVVNSRGQQ